MATYRLLEDHFVGRAGGTLLQAGQVVTTGVELPAGWVPTPNVDPLDTDAVNAFYAVGPVMPGPVRAQWSTIAVPAPTTYWTRLQSGMWALTALGAQLAPQWAWRF
jgi:hypothetical protein